MFLDNELLQVFVLALMYTHRTGLHLPYPT